MVSWSVNFRRVFFIVAPNKLRRCTERIGRMHGTYSTKKGCTEVQPLGEYFGEGVKLVCTIYLQLLLHL